MITTASVNNDNWLRATSLELTPYTIPIKCDSKYKLMKIHNASRSANRKLSVNTKNSSDELFKQRGCGRCVRLREYLGFRQQSDDKNN